MFYETGDLFVLKHYNDMSPVLKIQIYFVADMLDSYFTLKK